MDITPSYFLISILRCLIGSPRLLWQSWIGRDITGSAEIGRYHIVAGESNVPVCKIYVIMNYP